MLRFNFSAQNTHFVTLNSEAEARMSKSGMLWISFGNLASAFAVHKYCVWKNQKLNFSKPESSSIHPSSLIQSFQLRKWNFCSLLSFHTILLLWFQNMLMNTFKLYYVCFSLTGGLSMEDLIDIAMTWSKLGFLLPSFLVFM